MKKAILTLAAMAIALTASAQLNFGVKAGANFNTATGIDYPENTKSGLNIGFNAGAVVEFGLTDLIALRAEALYSLQGATTHTKYENTVAGATVKFNELYKCRLPYINIPVMAELVLLDGDLLVMAGPQVGFGLGASYRTINKEDKDYTTKWADGKLDKDDYKDTCNGVDFSIAIGAEYMLDENIGIDFRYNLGLTYVEKEYEVLGKTVQPQGKNGVLQIGVVYKF